MKKGLFLLLIIGAAGLLLNAPLEKAPSDPASTAPAQRFLEKVLGTDATDGAPIYVTGSTVNVRTGPGTLYQKIHAFKRGQKLIFDGETSGKWAKIVAPQAGIEGWMHRDYLSAEVPRVRKVAVPRQQLSAPRVSNGAIRKEIIRNSIARYPGSCPCPYSRDRAGRRCGGRSAYSRPGGYSPICYDGDITAGMIESWRARRRGATIAKN